MRLLFHWLTLVLGLYLISLISPLGIGFDRPGDLLLAAFILMIFNAILKPILIIITLPLVLISFVTASTCRASGPPFLDRSS
jgi:putative membrane protein